MYIKEKRSNNIFIKLYQRKFNVSDGYSEADTTRPSYLLFYGGNAVSTLPQIKCMLFISQPGSSNEQHWLSTA